MEQIKIEKVSKNLYRVALAGQTVQTDLRWKEAVQLMRQTKNEINK